MRRIRLSERAERVYVRNSQQLDRTIMHNPNYCEKLLKAIRQFQGYVNLANTGLGKNSPKSFLSFLSEASGDLRMDPEKRERKDGNKRLSQNDSAKKDHILRRGKVGDKKMNKKIARKDLKTKMAVTADFLKVTKSELQVVVTMLLFLGVSIYLMTMGGL